MSAETEHASRPFKEEDSYYDDLDEGVGCVGIQEYIQNRRDD